MYKIYKTTLCSPVDFAAEELKKYLRMMMPDRGEIDIAYDPNATDGFRLGLLADLGLPCEAEDPSLDDVIHIDTTENGGILAGSNPRSVLFAVYRFLKCNGCRFLFPGTDGEYIPRKQIAPTSYHKLADHRYRGHTTEGDPSLEEVLHYIDYHAKQELNTYAVYEIFPYHRRHYLHRYNEQNRPPEPVDRELVHQWQALCEAELTKRGMLLWAGGHGWVDRTAGFNMKDRYLYKSGKKALSEDIRANLAMIGSKRGLNRSDPSFTNLCMSRADLRTKLATLVLEYARKNQHLDQIGVSLADTSHNHCECPECQKKAPSDFYVMIMNELDDMLTREGIDVRIQLTAYVDCMFAPQTERLKNPDRFILKATPISRNYTQSITEDTVFPAPQTYARNGWRVPKCTEDYFSLFKTWQAVFPGTCIAYEYHYWIHQYRDPGMVAMSRRVYEDVRSWKLLGLDGGIQDGSNKSFFPNGFIDHIYNATLMDRDLDYDKAMEDYFYHAYGQDWPTVLTYLQEISTTFDHSYMCGYKSIDNKINDLYDPGKAADFAHIQKLTAAMRTVIEDHMAMPTRPQTVCWRLLLRHTQWCDGLADALTFKCRGDTQAAVASWEQFLLEFGKHDHAIGRYFDFGLAANSITSILKKRPKTEF